MTPFTTDAYLTPQQVAERFHIGLSTVYVHIKARRLPAVRFGKTVRVPVSRLEKWLQQQERG